MDKFSQLFLYIPGIIIFLVGSGQVRGWMRRLRPGQNIEGRVLSCDHVVKTDKKDREVFNFYNVLVEYTDAQTQHVVRQSVKSPTEYAPGQPVRVYFGQPGEGPSISEKEDETLFHPIVLMLGGALLILLALWQNQGNEVAAMICLALVMFGAGLSMVLNYLRLKRRGLVSVKAEITDIYKRQISRATKILRADKFTYYPIVRYQLDGKDCLRRCNINSGSEKSFTVGDTMTLYTDPKTGVVLEHGARLGFAIFGAVLLILGILVGLSTLSVL
ncbi:MAG: hypothetical protein IJU99_06100 [Lachnospiraceae bacterium]|nr:hypothetical protein [Lachnospiraceae bacterium]